MKDYMFLLCIYKYIGVNKAFGTFILAWENCTMHFLLAHYGLNIYIDHTFKGFCGEILFNKVIHKYCHNKIILNAMYCIALQIQLHFQHVQLNDIWIIDYKYLQKQRVLSPD